MLSRLSSNYQTFRLNIYQYQSDYAAYTEAFIDKAGEEEPVAEAAPVEEEPEVTEDAEGAENEEGTEKKKKKIVVPKPKPKVKTEAEEAQENIYTFGVVLLIFDGIKLGLYTVYFGK